LRDAELCHRHFPKVLSTQGRSDIPSHDISPKRTSGLMCRIGVLFMSICATRHEHAYAKVLDAHLWYRMRKVI